MKELKAKTGLVSSPLSSLAKTVLIDDIKLSPTFQSLFAINPATKSLIVESMKKSGFDKSQPVHLWRGILLDGHTRISAAKEAGLFSVPAFEHDFATEEEAVEYAVGLQVARRNLSDAELLSAVERLDVKKKTRVKDENDTGERGKSAERTAKLLGVSQAKVEKARAVSAHASDEVKAAVKNGAMSLNAASKTWKCDDENLQANFTDEEKNLSDFSTVVLKSRVIEVDNDGEHVLKEGKVLSNGKKLVKLTSESDATKTNFLHLKSLVEDAWKTRKYEFLSGFLCDICPKFNGLEEWELALRAKCEEYDDGEDLKDEC
ncbi:MAG: ParB/RepB/Spo0J family partition protein [Clostridia bacterium]|nr:ParB/RepB/Spo0J family partition protein [Clostridia bacterium]